MIRVQKDAFDAGLLTNTFLLANPNSGGIATFIGQVRDFQGDKENPDAAVSLLELEHYPGMTEKELSRLESEARKRWDIDDVFIIHRFGALKPSEPIVLVCTASAHREAAFEACEFLMDQLKTNAPFWKRERTETGLTWVSARSSDEVRADRWSASDD